MVSLEFFLEITMQIIIGAIAYLFWTGYRRSRTGATLIMTLVFTFVFFYHLIAALYLEDIRGIEFNDPWEPHHVILYLTFGSLAYILVSERLRGAHLRDTSLKRRQTPGEKRKAG